MQDPKERLIHTQPPCVAQNSGATKLGEDLENDTPDRGMNSCKPGATTQAQGAGESSNSATTVNRSREARQDGAAVTQAQGTGESHPAAPI